MTSRMLFRIRIFHLALVALVPFAFASAVSAASDAIPETPSASAAAVPTGQLETLKEVFVHGTKLATRISRAEDDLYALYNRLNKNPDYDIVCGNMSLRPGSLITDRVCVPGFVADEVGPGAPTSDVASMNEPINPSFTGNCTSSVVVGYDLNGPAFYEAGCVTLGGPSRATTMNSSLLFTYTGRIASYNAVDQVHAAQLVTPERRKAYAENVMDVIHSDLRLTNIATRLSVMYKEMDSVRDNYAQRKAEARAARALDPAKPNLGPRSSAL